ncbi:MAG: hypothetical protein NXH96_10565 [Alteromonadaceae bacterium]|nr:hypothetical protein [Alteromonadaceae bacterium]
MPSYRRRATDIRRSLEEFEKTQFIATVIQYLNEDGLSRLDFAGRMPHLCFLLIEWRFQAERTEGRRECTPSDISRLVRKLSDLQPIAMAKPGQRIDHLGLSRMMISQYWFQEHPVVWNYEIVRYHLLLLGQGASTWFREAFYSETDINLNDFLMFCLALNAYFQHKNGLLAYGSLISLFVPHYDINYLAKMISLFGGKFTDIEAKLGEFYEQSVGENDYFRETRLMDFPIILSESRALVIHKTVSSRGIGRIVANILKRVDSQKFRKKFTKEFEKHVNGLADGLSGDLVLESQIREELVRQGKRSKVVDCYLTQDDFELFIDAKGVEPKDSLKYSGNVDTVKRALTDNVLKGVEQACETKLNYSSKANKIEERFVVVVVNEALPFSYGAGLERAVGGVFDSVRATYGEVFKPENIFFLAIDEFEGMVALDQKEGINVWDVLQYAAAASSTPKTAKYRFRQFFWDLTGERNGERKSPIATDQMAELSSGILSDVENIADECSEFWRTRGTTDQRVRLFVQLLNVLNQKIGV